MTAPVLAARGVGVRVDGATILDDVDLDVLAGEVLVLAGPNGAGKSTLLGVLAGDTTPTTGTVTWDGEPLAAIGAGELARRRGVLLQETPLSFPFRVVDVVRMGRAPWRGTDREERDDVAVAGAHVTADVLHLAARRFPSLSGGEKARTSFARVLAQEPRLLLLDEPTAALDIRHQEHVLAQARERSRAGDAVVVVLHDLSLAAAWADRVVVLDGGRVAGRGTPDEVLTDDLLTDVYRHPVRTLRLPGTGELLVLPARATAPTPEPSRP
jgi:iron complex transport system ATP-binding protein